MHLLRFFVLALGPMLVASPLPAVEPAAGARALSGEIGGASWAAATPPSWTGYLLIEAPDVRHAPQTRDVHLDLSTPEHQALLNAGWALATTNYRRTGPILADAIDDLRALRDQLATEIGPAKLIVIDGEGMGGLIATLLAEHHADEFHGFLARDPRLAVRDPRALRLRCDHQPRGPLLFLFGPETAQAVIDYQDKARAVANAESTVPVLWYQAPATDGESVADSAIAPVSRLGALQALVAWIQTRQSPAPRLDNLPAQEELAPAPEETPAAVPVREIPPLPDEPPPTVPVDESPR